MKTFVTVIMGLVVMAITTTMEAQMIPPGGGTGGNGTTNTYTPPPDISNYLKYQAQSFLVLDTNAVAATDPNLFNALTAMPDDHDTNSVLQVVPYGGNCLLFKASHFDYSGEAARDFCLVVCDQVEMPLYKDMDLSNPSNNIQNGGWLVQGSVPAWKTVDPMFLMVSNTSRIYNGFFRVIPYGGPVVQLSGAQPNDTVSNLVTVQASVTDLSGITNEAFTITVDGNPARYGVGASNTINLNTKYNPNGICTVYANAANTARIYDPVSPPDNTKIFFSGTGTLPLDFENDVYLAFASDYASPDIGQNYFLFVINQAQYIDATISYPDSGQLAAHYSGYVPNAATLQLPWDFTEAGGSVPYSNDTYVVTFTASSQAFSSSVVTGGGSVTPKDTGSGTTITITNKIDREGVRTGAGCFLTYQWEDPSDPTGNYLNNQADTWINQTLKSLYQNLYQSLSLTQYTTDQVGTNRNHSACAPYNSTSLNWQSLLQPALSNSMAYSDFTIAEAHGSGVTIGGGSYLTNKFSAQDLALWVSGFPHHQNGNNWRLRKAALWTCYSGDLSSGATAGGSYASFPYACGILRSLTGNEPAQNTSYMRKNCGLFFGGLLPQGGFAGTSATTAQVAEFLDQTWVCGQNQYPGGCDPTYSFRFAVNATRGMYNPQLDSANPLLIGYSKMIYSSVYDDELMLLNTAHVKDPNY